MKCLLPTSDRNQAGATLRAGAILRAVDTFKLENDIQIKWSNGTRIIGGYRQRGTLHVITLSTYEDAETTSRSLWHELTHAKQSENAGGWSAMRRDRRHRSQWGDYYTSPFEVQARKYSDAMHPQLPLAS